VSTGTLDVRVRGHTIFPPTICGRLHILLAILRQIHLIIAIAIASKELEKLEPDAFVVDQLSACVPLLRWLYPRRQRTLFYCHFPDQLLANRGGSGPFGILKKAYRLPFDWFEGWSMSASDRIVVNSNFTKSVAANVWPSLGHSLGVVYPCVSDLIPSDSSDGPLWQGKFKIMLSINRFERKKDIALAIRAYSKMPEAARQGTRLVIAGGYDTRVQENVQYHKELSDLAEGFGLATATARTVPTALGVPVNIQVLFLLSVPSNFKNTLLGNATLLLYTPTNEHFGIVPVEAMQHGLPVLASNTGGPLETIVEGETGWLRDSDDEKWANVIEEVLNAQSTASLEQMGRRGRDRVHRLFTRAIMATRFDEEISSILQSKRSPFIDRKDIGLALFLLAAFATAFLATIIRSRFSGKGDMRASEFARARSVYAKRDEAPHRR
jgi:alpha-1,3/alpha-1,6-mannosyltransferase